MIESIQAPSLSVGEIFKDAWSLAFKKIGKMIVVLLGVSLIPIMLCAIPIGVQYAMTAASGTPKDGPLSTIGGGAMFLLSLSLTLPCWLKACVRVAQQQEFSFKELMPSFSTLLNTAGTFLLVIMAMGIGIVLLVIPGIFVAVKLQFAAFYAVDKGMNPIEAMKASWAATKGVFWPVVGIDVIFGILNNIASWTVIGPLFVAPAVGTAMALTYLRTQRTV